MNNSTCPTCGAKINAGENFCRTCGSKLPNNNINNDAQPLNNQEINQQTEALNSTHQSNMNQETTQPNLNNNSNNINFEINQPVNNQMPNSNNDDDLVKAYIGKNADELLKANFSFCSFFLGALYALYRKMWALGLIWIAVNTVSLIFLKSFSSILNLALTIFFAITFKKYYLKHVREEVEKIKTTNPNKPRTELIELCSKKGGTTVIPVVFFTIIWVSLLGALILIFKITDLIDSNQNYQGNSATGSLLIKNLNVTIPSSFKESSYSTDTLKMYHLTSNTDACDLTIKYQTDYYNRYDVKEYLEEEIIYTASDTYSGISTKNINNETWTVATVVDKYDYTTYYYAILKDKNIYEIEFSVLSDDEKTCSNAHNTLLNSLRFK